LVILLSSKRFRQLKYVALQDGMSLLSSPCTVREDDDPFFEKVLLTLSDMRTPESLRWLQYYVDFTKPTLSSPSMRNAFIAALADREFSRAWEWIRNWDFQSDLKIQISEAAVAEGVHYEEDAEDLEAMSAERERLLVVLLDRVFKRGSLLFDRNGNLPVLI
jgi:hypothetical protein